ncbi:MAG: acyl--CoA ligase [Chlorobi bacterium]|nr:acyl--CoA ligase [Chlorobiota bacterium]
MLELTELIGQARSVRGIPFSELDVPFTSIGDLLAYQARKLSEKEWLIWYDDHGNRTALTYADFLAQVNSTARFLLNKGITRGSRVATVTHNNSETVVQYFAVWFLGGTVVPINVGEDDERVSYTLINSEASLAFVRSEYLDRVASLKEKLPSLQTIVACGDLTDRHDETVWFEDYNRVLREGVSAPLLLPRRYLLDQECLIVYTSGTTGPPKGVLLTHGNLLADAIGISEWHCITETTRMMCVLPIHHVNGTVVTLVTPMYAGGSVVLNRKFQSGSFFQRIAEEGVAVVSVVPTLLAYLCSAKIDVSGLDLSQFRHVICGAGPLTCELADRFEDRYGVPIIHGYGLSETTCYSCFLPVSLTQEVRRAWLTEHGFPSIGLPIPQNEMAIHDENANQLEPGQRGEIVVRGHNVMSGYSNNNEANEKAFAYGWFRSGDEGFYLKDDDGNDYFFITGRLKELIIRGGVNLSPLEIDEVLNSNKKIDVGIAVAFENSWYGEEVGAYVRKADESLTEEEVLAFCAEHLPFSKQPKVVLFGDEVPVTSTGKYQRNKVKGLFVEYKNRQFRETRKSS